MIRIIRLMLLAAAGTIALPSTLVAQSQLPYVAPQIESIELSGWPTNLTHARLVSLTADSDQSTIPPAVMDACYSVARIVLSEGRSPSMGSGAYIGDGLWLTNAHVVRPEFGGGSYSVTLKDGRSLPARLIAAEWSGQPDVAIVETSPLDDILPPIPISDEAPRAGDIVYPTGFDKGNLQAHRVWPAKVAGFFTDGDGEAVGLGNRRGSISGNSGGPVLNSQGELVAPLFANGGHPQDTQTGMGSTIFVSWRGCRTFLLPFRERIVRALAQQRGMCPPGMQCPPSYPQQGYPSQPIPQPQPIAGGTIPSFRPQPQPGPTPSPTPGCSCDQEKLIAAVLERMAKDDRFKGPKGDPGKDGVAGMAGPAGKDGEINAMHLAAVTESILATIRMDDRFRGPRGEPGPVGPAGSDASVDVAKLTEQILAQVKHPGQRVVLVDGKSGKVIDDETYESGEPIVLDFQSIIRSGK